MKINNNFKYIFFVANILLFPFSIYSQPSEDFFANGIGLGHTIKKFKHFQGYLTCSEENLEIIECVYTFGNHLKFPHIKNSKEKYGSREYKYTIKINPITKVVIYYIFKIDKNKYYIEKTNRNIDNVFEDFNEDLLNSFHSIVAYDKNRNISIWESNSRIGFSWEDQNYVYFEACNEIQQCEIYKNKYRNEKYKFNFHCGIRPFKDNLICSNKQKENIYKLLNYDE